MKSTGKKGRVLTLDSCKRKHGGVTRSCVRIPPGLKMFIDYLDGLEFAEVEDSLSSVCFASGASIHVIEKNRHHPELQRRRVAEKPGLNNRYVYGSVETCDALRAGREEK